MYCWQVALRCPKSKLCISWNFEWAHSVCRLPCKMKIVERCIWSRETIIWAERRLCWTTNWLGSGYTLHLKALLYFDIFISQNNSTCLWECLWSRKRAANKSQQWTAAIWSERRKSPWMNARNYFVHTRQITKYFLIYYLRSLSKTGNQAFH